MIRILKVTAITLLLAGGAFACVLWSQWAKQIRNSPAITDTRTDEQKARAKFALAFSAPHSNIAQSIYFAQLHAVRGDFERAQEIATYVIENCDPDLLQWVEKYVTAYADETVYVENPSDPKFYNLLSSPIEFFHAKEHY